MFHAVHVSRHLHSHAALWCQLLPAGRQLTDSPDFGWQVSVKQSRRPRCCGLKPQTQNKALMRCPRCAGKQAGGAFVEVADGRVSRVHCTLHRARNPATGEFQAYIEVPTIPGPRFFLGTDDPQNNVAFPAAGTPLKPALGCTGGSFGTNPHILISLKPCNRSNPPLAARTALAWDRDRHPEPTRRAVLCCALSSNGYKDLWPKT